MRGNSVRNPAEKPLDGMGLAIVNQIMNGRLLEKASYGQCLICAGDVEIDGAMVFRCGDTPGRDLTVNILRSEVEADEQDL